MLALDLEGSAWADGQGHNSKQQSCEAGQIRKKQTFIFLETAMVKLGCQTCLRQAGWVDLLGLSAVVEVWCGVVWIGGELLVGQNVKTPRW